MKTKITFLVVVAVALFGVSAASASAASLFLAAKYPVLVEALGGTQTFEAGGAKSVCSKIVAMTGEEGSKDPTGPSATLLIHPRYLECNVTISAVLVPAKVLTTGCNYAFHAALSLTKEGSVDVECEAGKLIQIELEGTLLGCVISVPSQNGLSSVDYMTNEPSSGEVTVTASVTSIAWKATSLCGLTKASGTEATYTGSAHAKGTSGESTDALSID
jgi:hypothetical protein